MRQVLFRGTREQARNAIIGVVRSITGDADTHLSSARSVHTAMGLAALSDIKDDYVRKADGNVGEDGERWAPLSRKYLAYGRRFGSGEQAKLKKAAGLGSAHRHAPGKNKGLLTKAQLKRWRGIFVSQLNKRAASAASVSEAKGAAAAIAWAVLKREGAKTKLEVFGDRTVQILRDTGVLLNSLSPGVLSSAQGNYSPPVDQIFALTRSGVIVGTNVPYAGIHQNGSTKRNIPARPFLPVDRAPAVWVRRWIQAAAIATSAAIQHELGAA